MKKLESRTVQELLSIAREMGLSGYSKLKKADLVKLITKHQKQTSSETNQTKSPSSVEKKTTPTQPVQSKQQANQAPENRPKTVDLDEPSRMGLLPRDPHWLYCFWDLRPEEKGVLQTRTAYLRVLELDDGEREIEKIALPKDATSWYVQVERANRTYRCDLGVLVNKNFEVLLSSNLSTTPPESIQATASEWIDKGSDQTPTQRADFLHALSLGPDKEQTIAIGSSEARLQQASVSSEATIKSNGDGQQSIRLDADLILYGTTQPGSQVMVAGVPIQLDHNGHFKARFALPDGLHSFSLVGIGPEGKQQEIELQVQRQSGN